MLHARVAEDEGSEDQPCAEDGEGPALRPAAEPRADSQHGDDSAAVRLSDRPQGLL
jgi:hypothetical protein